MTCFGLGLLAVVITLILFNKDKGKYKFYKDDPRSWGRRVIRTGRGKYAWREVRVPPKDENEAGQNQMANFAGMGCMVFSILGLALAIILSMAGRR